MLYTKKGDTGTTKLFDSVSGERISKDDIIFDLLGTLDELNSSIGYAKALTNLEDIPYVLTIENTPIPLQELLESLQNNMFSMQAEIAGTKDMVPESYTAYGEKIVSAVEEVIPSINSFLITGGDVVSAYLDVCRTVARRAERIAVKSALQYPERISGYALQFLNRLSSVLYALARFVNYTQNLHEKPPTYTS